VWRHHSSGTVGRQTVARSELAAALWALQKAGRPTTVVTDSRYVHDGVYAVQRGEGASLLEGLDGDLWRQVKAAPDATMVWIPSHKSWEEASARGHSREDWLGNREADRRAGEMAEGRMAPPNLSRFQDRRLELARAALSVIGAVHQAALEHDSVPGFFSTA